MAVDSYKEARGGEHKGKPKLHHLEIHKGKNGHKVVHVHHHSMGPMGMEPSDDVEHYFSKDQGEELLAHIEKHAGISTGAGTASEAEPDEESEKVKPEPKRTEAEEKGED